MVLENVQQLKTLINRIRSDPTQSTNPLTMKLNGTLDAAVNGGVSKFEVGTTITPHTWYTFPPHLLTPSPPHPLIGILHT